MNKNILIIGEKHHGTHLEEVKNIFAGISYVNKIFIELPISHQVFINEYLEKGTINDRLNKTFEGASKEGNSIKETILFIFDFAKNKKIPVFSIDSSKVQDDKYKNISLYGKWFLKGESRDEDMFNNFIDNYFFGEKVVIFCGANHLSENLHFRTGKETFGTRMKNKFKDDVNIIILK